MNRLVALALVLGAGSASGREPLLVPPAADSDLYRQVEFAPPNEHELAALGAPPPAPGLAPQRDRGYAPQPVPVPEGHIVPGPAGQIPGQYPGQYPGQIIPGQAGPLAGQMEPGIICDACDGLGMPLYTDVRVRRSWNIHPCAVPKIVAVPDPCTPYGCVFIEICVPPCACEQVIYKRGGNMVHFDYGAYGVDVISRHGKVIVRYRS